MESRLIYLNYIIICMTIFHCFMWGRSKSSGDPPKISPCTKYFWFSAEHWCYECGVETWWSLGSLKALCSKYFKKTFNIICPKRTLAPQYLLSYILKTCSVSNLSTHAHKACDLSSAHLPIYKICDLSSVLLCPNILINTFF